MASRVFRGPASLVAALPRCVYPWLAVPAVPLASLRLGVRNFRKFFAAERAEGKRETAKTVNYERHELHEKEW